MNKQGKKNLSGAQKRKKKKEKEELAKELAADVERLKLGPTKLWTGLVLHHKDVFVAHVLPKLNETDRCIFAMAGGGSWEVLEYAGVDVLKLSPFIYECTSISTLEWSWNHMPWGEEDNDGNVMDRAWFCANVVLANKLEFLKWAREVKQCEWDEQTIEAAITTGCLEMLKYCHSNGCPYDVGELHYYMHLAGCFGHLDCLRFLFDNMIPQDNMIPPPLLKYMERETAMDAAGYGHTDIFKYLVEERKISDEVKEGCASVIIVKGNVECLKYLAEEARLSLNHWAYVAFARYSEQTECLNYLREKGCPEPSDEEYADFVEDREAEAEEEHSD